MAFELTKKLITLERTIRLEGVPYNVKYYMDEDREIIYDDIRIEGYSIVENLKQDFLDELSECILTAEKAYEDYLRYSPDSISAARKRGF